MYILFQPRFDDGWQINTTQESPFMIMIWMTSFVRQLPKLSKCYDTHGRQGCWTLGQLSWRSDGICRSFTLACFAAAPRRTVGRMSSRKFSLIEYSIEFTFTQFPVHHFISLMIVSNGFWIIWSQFIDDDRILLIEINSLIHDSDQQPNKIFKGVPAKISYQNVLIMSWFIYL